MNTQPVFANGTSGAQMGQQQPGVAQQQNQPQPGGFGQQGFGQQGQQQPGGFGAPGGMSNGSRGFGGFAPPPGQAGQQGQQGQQTGQPNQLQQSQGGFQGFGNSNGFGNTPTGGGGPIVGVASDSDKESIKIYNKRQKYNEWEFVALLNQNGQPPNGVQNPNAGQRQNNPFQTSPQNPTGSPTTPFGGNPFGTGQQTNPNPFGTGTNPFGTGTTTPNTPNPIPK
jgi:hypothetical protein